VTAAAGRPAVIGRVILVVIALGVIAWLAVSERNAMLTSQGAKAASQGDYATAERDLEAADFLNASTFADYSRAIVLQQAGRRDEAVALIEDVLRREPENSNAWSVRLLMAIQAKDKQAEERARAKLRELDPLYQPGGGQN
jgi:tetratricopeptide (TPR) repeat protein